MTIEAQCKREPVLVHLRRLAGGDERFPSVALSLVAQPEPTVLDTGVRSARLVQGVLDLEQVGEVGRRLDPDRYVHGLGKVIEDRQLFVESISNRSLANDGELRVDVGGSGAGNKEEPGFEVLEIVGRERIEPLVVDRQDPGR